MGFLFLYIIKFIYIIKDMSLSTFIKERLKVNKEYVDVHTEQPENIKELRKIIDDRIEEQGAGTLKEPSFTIYFCN